MQHFLDTIESRQYPDTMSCSSFSKERAVEIEIKALQEAIAALEQRLASGEDVQEELEAKKLELANAQKQ